MKKFIAVLAIALFVGSLSVPTFAAVSNENVAIMIFDGPEKPGDKVTDKKSDCSTAKKADCNTPCATAEKKSDCSTECTTAKKSDCNTASATAEKKACNDKDKK